MSKNHREGFEEYYPSYNYFSFENEGDSLFCRFLGLVEDWQGKPALLVEEIETGLRYYLGNHVLLNKLGAAPPNTIYDIVAGEKVETKSGQSVRLFEIYQPKGQGVKPTHLNPITGEIKTLGEPKKGLTE